jgi:Fe2+ transport system protein FeoA
MDHQIPSSIANEAISRTPETVPLTTLRAGERGRLHTANLCCDDCDLLNAMGLTEQCELRVCRRDRQGGACIVQVNATRLGLSAAMARGLMVSRA